MYIMYDIFMMKMDTGMPPSATTSPPVDLKRKAAYFILKTRDGRNLTQTALDGLLTDITELFQSLLEYAQQQTASVLHTSGVDKDVITAVSEVFKDDCLHTPFHGFESEYHQHKYFCDQLGMVVSQTAIVTSATVTDNMH